MPSIDYPHRDLAMRPASSGHDHRAELSLRNSLACRAHAINARFLPSILAGLKSKHGLRVRLIRSISGSNRMRAAAFVLGSILVGMLASGSAQSATVDEAENHGKALELLNRGKSLAAEGRLAEAEAPLIEAAKLAPEDLEILTNLAKVQGRIGKSAEAIRLFREATDLYPQVADAHLNLGIALADAGQLEAALKETTKAASLAPNMPSAHINRGRILDDLHRVGEARREFTIAYSLAPTNPDCLFYSSLVERESGNIVKESELLQKLVLLQPDNYKVAYFLGRSLQEQSRDSESIKYLRRALAIKPDYEEALYLLSRELRKTDPEESKRLDTEFKADRERRSTLDQIKSLGNEAYVAAGKEDWPDAIRLLRKALGVCDQCEVAAGLHKNLGLALCRSGDIDSGRVELQASLKLNPNDPDVVRALSLIGP